MKILQIIQREQLRGAEVFACQLSKELMSKGHEVEMVVLFGEKSGTLPFEHRIHYLHGNESRTWFDFPAFRKLRNIIVRGRFDIVQANAGDTLKYASLSRKFFGWQAKLAFRNANKISDFINNPIKRLVYTRLMNEVQLVASVSRECLRDFTQIFPELKKKMVYLPVGLDPISTSDQECPQDIAAISGTPKLLHVAGFMPEKNHRGLFRIFKRILNDHPQAKLILVGEGKLKSEMKQLAQSMGLESSVIFLGKRHDVKQIMKGSDILLLPSLIEGLPAVILESFQQHLPVVAYDVGGISEVVMDRQTGRLVRKNDEIAFVAAVEDCIHQDMGKMTSAAAALVAGRYSNVLIAEGFITAYAETILN